MLQEITTLVSEDLKVWYQALNKELLSQRLNLGTCESAVVWISLRDKSV
jgi:hypothetical protein